MFIPLDQEPANLPSKGPDSNNVGHTHIISYSCTPLSPLSPWQYKNRLWAGFGLWVIVVCQSLSKVILGWPLLPVACQGMLPTSSALQVSYAFSDSAFSKSKIREQSLLCWVWAAVGKFQY